MASGRLFCVLWPRRPALSVDSTREACLHLALSYFSVNNVILSVHYTGLVEIVQFASVSLCRIVDVTGAVTHFPL